MICHEIIDNLERRCKERYNVQLVIHYDPIVTDDAELKTLRETVLSLLQKQDARITIHDFRMVRGEEYANLIFDIVLPASLMGKCCEVKKRLDSDLATLDDNTYYTVVEFDMEGFN